MDNKEFLEKYTSTLLSNLTQLLRSKGLVSERLPETPDISEMWDKMVETYCADAVKEIAKYPTVALGWAMYLGMGVAKYWDDDWATYSQHPNLYLHIRDIRGFDYMDEVVRGELLGLSQTLVNFPEKPADRIFTAPGKTPYAACEVLVRSCAQMAHDQIRHEQIEPSSPLAYYTFIASCRILYLIGAAVGLRHCGYNMVAQA